MKNKLHILTSILTLALISACTSNQGLTTFEDDIYYSPKDDQKNSPVVAAVVESPVVAEEYVDIDERDYGYDQSASDQKAAEDYYDPNYRKELEQEQKATTINNYYGDYYEDDDYYYSNRNRRFNNFNSGFGYYSPFYSYGNWYSYDPFMPRPSYWNPYFSPGFSMGWNSYFGWSYSYSSWGPGWGMSMGYGNPFGFNPYYGGFNSYYYCPTAYYGGYNGGDYYNRTPVYTGQFTPYGSSVGTNSTDLSRGFRTAAQKDLKGELRPSTAPNLYQGTRPVEQNVNNGSSRPANTSVPNDRPVDTRPIESKPSETRDETPSYVRPEIDQSRPVEGRPINQPESRPVNEPKEDSRPPVYTRPVETSPAPREEARPRQERRNPDRGSVSTPRVSSPSRSSTPSNNGGSGSATGRTPR